MKDILLYWPRFFREGWFNIRYYRAVRSVKAELEEAGLRVDWIGRIYTVINLKEEFINQPELVQQSSVFQQLKPVSETLLKYGLSNEAFPEISRINQTSYLVVLYPENDHFNWISFLRNIMFVGSLALIIYGVIESLKYFL